MGIFRLRIWNFIHRKDGKSQNQSTPNMTFIKGEKFLPGQSNKKGSTLRCCR